MGKGLRFQADFELNFGEKTADTRPLMQVHGPDHERYLDGWETSSRTSSNHLQSLAPGVPSPLICHRAGSNTSSSCTCSTPTASMRTRTRWMTGSRQAQRRSCNRQVSTKSKLKLHAYTPNTPGALFADRGLRGTPTATSQYRGSLSNTAKHRKKIERGRVSMRKLKKNAEQRLYCFVFFFSHCHNEPVSVATSTWFSFSHQSNMQLKKARSKQRSMEEWTVCKIQRHLGLPWSAHESSFSLVSPIERETERDTST